MDRRSNESPMDFEWQTHGPADVTSPFYQLSQRQGQRRGFDSPSKSTILQPDTTSSFASSATTATPFRNPSFTTPRKAFDPDLFSETSGAESSPADNADAEDTPETTKTVTEMTAFKSGSPKKKPLFGRYGIDFSGTSPGRGELRRAKHADAIIHKVRKRRRVDRDYAVASGRRGSSEYGSDGGDSKGRGGKGQANTIASRSWIGSILTFIESKPTLPYILSYYAQLLLNYFLVGFVIYLVYCFWVTVRSDVDKASEAAVGAVIAEMAQCAAQYTENKCSKDMRVPAMATLCESWEACMNRDPNHVGRARVSAHTFAEIFNSFVEPISWKAMTFVVVIIVVCFGVNNFAFGVFRAKVSHPPPVPSYPQQYDWGVPQTPRHPSQPMSQPFYGGDGVQNFPAIMPSQTSGQRSPRKGNW